MLAAMPVPKVAACPEGRCNAIDPAGGEARQQFQALDWIRWTLERGRRRNQAMDPNVQADVDALTAAALSQLTGQTVLNCLNKQPGPPALAADLAHFLDFTESVFDNFWTVMKESLGAINTHRNQELLASFCASHHLPHNSLSRAVGACRFLILRGVENNTAPDLFAEDVAQLLKVADASEKSIGRVQDLLVPLYQKAAPSLRMDAVYQALVDHGKVVRDVRWRVDHISHANTGEAINMPVTILTLRYNEGDQSSQATFQLLPDELRQLQAACEQALR